jgi:hypothetical protein
MVLLWHIVDIEIALPFQLRAVGEMVQSVTHIAGIVSFTCWIEAAVVVEGMV